MANRTIVFLSRIKQGQEQQLAHDLPIEFPARALSNIEAIKRITICQVTASLRQWSNTTATLRRSSRTTFPHRQFNLFTSRFRNSWRRRRSPQVLRSSILRAMSSFGMDNNSIHQPGDL